MHGVPTDADRQFRVLADAIPLLCWMANPDGHIYWYNRGWYDYTGTTFSQMEGWGWKSVHDPALLDDVIERWTRSLQSGKAFEQEFPLRRADGVFRWHLTRAVPIHDAEGRIERWIGSNTDIEDARRARTIAEEERARMYQVFMAAPAFICALRGPDHVFEFANPQYARLAGAGRTLIGRKARDAFPEIEGQGFFELLDEVYRTGVPFVGNAMPVNLDRTGSGALEQVWINFVYQPRDSGDGKVAGITCFGFEVTDQVVARRNAEEASAQKDAFLAMLAHELRNPLAPMMNATAVLKLDVGAAAQARARDVVERQVRHLGRLVDDLLDVSRIARGKVELKCEDLELVGVVGEIVTDLAESARAAGIEVSTHLPERPVPLCADRTRLIQTISNVLGNAIKFTPSGGKIEVTVGSDDTGEDAQAEISVRDTGIGMDPSFVSRIFDPFTQGDTSLDRSRGGLGLGLAVAKGIAELHDGSLTAESPGPGKGSTFRIRLPLRAPAPAGRHGQAKAARAPRRQRIMIIEDNVDQGDTLRDLLEVGGHDVRLERSGADALDAIRRFCPDVVLCDLGLPGKDGFAIAGAIRADPALKGLRLIALSGYGTPEDRARTEKAGFDHHLTKPVDPETIDRLLVTP